jgi:hypothetical protein
MAPYELAWAAGFFDGEGSTVHGIVNERVTIGISIAQTDERPLTRFKAAVGIGAVNGPYQPKNPKHKPSFAYTVNTFEHTQAVIAMLWRWLCEAKKEQATAALMLAGEYGRKRQAWKDLNVCNRGHPMAGPDAKVYYYRRKDGKEVRQCQTCRSERRDRETAMIVAALEGKSHGL